MNRKQAQFILENIEVFKHFSNGGKVQVQSPTSFKWDTILDPSFIPGYKYRKKPEAPKEIYVIENGSQNIWYVKEFTSENDRRIRYVLAEDE